MDEILGPREAAIRRVQAKRAFRTHLAVYVVVNAVLVMVWAFGSDRQGFWPFWTIVGWGIGLAFHGWSAYFRAPITEGDIDREMRRGR